MLVAVLDAVLDGPNGYNQVLISTTGLHRLSNLWDRRSPVA